MRSSRASDPTEREVTAEELRDSDSSSFSSLHMLELEGVIRSLRFLTFVLEARCFGHIHI